MPSLLERLPSGSRIAAIRLRSLGDCVLTTPALALLKAYRPDVRVAVVVEDRFRAVFEGNPDVDEILPPEIGAILRWRARVALNLHGGTRSMVLAVASGARIRAGFGHHRHSFLYSVKIPRAQEILGEERPVHTAEHLASAMFWLGVPRVSIPRAKLVAERGVAETAATAPFGRGSVTGRRPGGGLGSIADRESGMAHGPAARRESAADRGLVMGRESIAGLGNYAVLHPFASEPGKTWPASRFAAVAERLRAGGLEPVFVAGPDDDTRPFEGFRVWRGAPLAEVKSLMAGAQIFIGNDSGPAHIAAAFGVPVVAIFGASNPVTWAPWRTEARVLTSPQGIGAIETSEVIAAMEELKVRA